MDSTHPTMPGLNGGTLKRGNTINVGAKRSEVRLACIEGLNMAIPLLTQMLLDHFSGKKKLSTKELCNITDVLGKYGAGTVSTTELTGQDGEQLKVVYTFGVAAMTPEALPQATEAILEATETNSEELIDGEFTPQESGPGFWPEFRRHLY